jgi:Zn-dependent M28 family amino/carboxypeptidase
MRIPVGLAPLAVLVAIGAGCQSTPTAQLGLPTTLVTPGTTQLDRLKADVERIAIERAPGSDGWRKVRTLLEKSLESAHFQVEIQPFDEVGRNVIATRRGTTAPEQVVVLSAHYDHIPGCKGADDNASGVAVVLEAARQLSQRSFARTLVIAFWDREEEGLIGSGAWATHAKQRNADIRVMLALDGVGFSRSTPNSQRLPPGAGALLPDVANYLAVNEGRADFIAALGDSESAQTLGDFETAGSKLGLPAIGIEVPISTRTLLADVTRSDHASFWRAGYPGILITDTANFRNPYYHCRGGSDEPGTLDYAFLNKVASVVIRTVEDSL